MIAYATETEARIDSLKRSIARVRNDAAYGCRTAKHQLSEWTAELEALQN